MANPSVKVNVPDFVETVYKGHAVFLEKLKNLNESDSSFFYWLSSAALDLCVNSKIVKLQNKPTYVDELVLKVKEFLQQMKVNDLLEEERDCMEYCKALFKQTFEAKPDESKTDKNKIDECNLKEGTKSKGDYYKAKHLSDQQNIPSSSEQPTIISKTGWGMNENVQPDRDRLLELNAEYLSSLHLLRLEDIQEQFNNCLVFRVSLYILRERLFTFIRERFNEVIQGLSEYSNSSIKKTIKDYVRTTDPFGRSLEHNANQRKRRIEALDERQLTADWRTFAVCYMGSFLTWRDTKINQFKVDKVDYADPKDLLEILKNCSLFSATLYQTVCIVIRNRDKYYEHLYVLLIDSETLVTITHATYVLLDLISAQHVNEKTERNRMGFSHECFTQPFGGKPEECNTVEETRATVSKEPEEEVDQDSTTVTGKKRKAMERGYEEAICVIGRQAFKRPKILPCSHVFCMHCLEETGKVTNKNPGDMMSCERCGKEFKIPNEGFDGLNNFEEVEKVIEPAQVLEPSSRNNTCEVCAENSDLDNASEIPPAVVYCVDCKKMLCVVCRRCHNSLLKTHKVQELEDPQNASAALAHLTIKSKTDEMKQAAVSSAITVSFTTLQDLPTEVLDYILMKVVVKKVMDEKLAKQAWIDYASHVIKPMRTVWSVWNCRLATRWFKIVLSRTLNSKDCGMMQFDEKRLLELKEDYLRRLQLLRHEKIEEQFNNCLVFRISLYILRERLFAFIRERFEDFIQGLSNDSNSCIKRMIKDNVRTTDPFGSFFKYAKQRKARIAALDESQFTADWRTFARCYMGSFLTCNNTHIKQYKVTYADPKDLLEILKNCSLFSNSLHDAAYCVIHNRDQYYGHLSALLIDTDTLKVITSATESLMLHIMAEPFLG